MISEVSFCGAVDIDPRSLGNSTIRCATAITSLDTVWVGLADGALLELDTSSGALEKRLPCSSSKNGAVNFLVPFADCVAVGFGRGVVLVNFDGALVHTLSTAEVQGAICGGAVGEHLFVGGVCGKVAVWDLSNSETPLFVRSLGAHSGAVTCVAVPPEPGGWFIATGSATGEVALWTESRARHVVLRQSSPVTGLLFVNNGTSKVDLWCGFADGIIRVWKCDDNEQKTQLRAHASGVTSLVRNSGEDKVWSTGVDGTAASWDVNSHTELLRVRHSGELVGVVPINRASVWRLWVLSMQGGVQCYVSQAFESSSAADIEMKKLADLAMEQVRQQHSEIQRLSSALSASRNAAPTTWIESEESYSRRIVSDLWRETTQTAFVSFLVSLKALRATDSELAAVRDERDYLKNLLATQERFHRDAPRHDVASSPIRLVTETSLAAQLSEKDQQLRILQNELIHQRRIAVDSLHSSSSEAAAQIRVLQQALDDERSAKTTLSHELLRMENRLTEASRECESLKEKIAKEASTSEQKVKNAVKAFQRAAELEVAELRLAMQQQREAHEQESQRWTREILAMKKPWESMKKALADAHSALEQSRAEFRAETTSLENTIRQQSIELDLLRSNRTQYQQQYGSRR